MAAYSLKSENIGLLILLNCESASLTVFTTCVLKSNKPVIICLLKTAVLSLKYLINLALVVSLGDV